MNDLNEPIEGELVEPRGPKAKFKQEMCDQVVACAATGEHIAGMMMTIGVKSKDTWYRWQQEYPEFKEAVEYAKIVSQAYYERLGLMGVRGEVPNFNASTFALLMNNKFSDDYKRGSSGNSGTEITLNTINYTPDQINEKIAQKLEKLKSLGVDLESK